MSPLKLSVMPSLPQLLLLLALLPFDMPASPLDILDWQLEELPTELDLVPDMASQSEVLPVELSELLEFHSLVAMDTLSEHQLPSRQCHRKLLTILLLLPLKILYYYAVIIIAIGSGMVNFGSCFTRTRLLT